MNINKLDRSALVSRLCHYYLSEGDSVEQALQKLRSELGHEYANAINLFESSLTVNPKTESKKGDELDSMVNSLACDVKSLSGDNRQLVNVTHEVLNKVTPGFKSCAKFFSALFLYPSILFVISLVIYSLYKTFIFPSMVSHAFEGNVPPLTKVFFSDVAGVLIAIGAILIVVFVLYQINYLIKSFSQIKPKKSLIGTLTGTDQHYAYLVFLAYLKILLKCGAQPNVSFEKAESYANLDEIKTDYYRHNKIALSVLREHNRATVLQEVDYQLDDVMGGLAHALTLKQEKILLSFQFCITIFIGYMVVAMYLPIFKLASIY